MSAQTLRPYQARTVAYLMDEWLPASKPGDRLLVTAPTGTGKGTVQLALVRALKARGCNPLILTPSLEVLRGYVARSGGDPDAGPTKLVAQAASIPATTPLRWRNAVLRGDAGPLPDVVLVDEAHHATDEAGGETDSATVAADVFALAQHARWIGWTATPYRGTPQGTRALEAAWPDAAAMLTLRQAADLGACVFPTFDVRPVLDDDVVAVRGGEFDRGSADKAAVATVPDLARLVSKVVEVFPRLRLPTVVTVPGIGAAQALADALENPGPSGGLAVAAALIVAATPSADRVAAYRRSQASECVLVVVDVLGEGVDLPWLRRWIDAAPTKSPVRWLQRLGRITRPGPRGEYWGTNRNLERHGYLLEGLLPPHELRASIDAGGFAPSPRVALGRSLGLDVLARRKPALVPLLHGGRAAVYALATVDRETGRVTELATILDPARPEPIVAARTIGAAAGGGNRYAGSVWRRLRCLPDDLKGYTRTVKAEPMSGPQEAWWKREAHHYGLDSSSAVDRREFVALPVLRDLGLTVGGDVATVGVAT